MWEERYALAHGAAMYVEGLPLVFFSGKLSLADATQDEDDTYHAVVAE